MSVAGGVCVMSSPHAFLFRPLIGPEITWSVPRPLISQPSLPPLPPLPFRSPNAPLPLTFCSPSAPLFFSLSILDFFFFPKYIFGRPKPSAGSRKGPRSSTYLIANARREIQWSPYKIGEICSLMKCKLLCWCLNKGEILKSIDFNSLYKFLWHSRQIWKRVEVLWNSAMPLELLLNWKVKNDNYIFAGPKRGRPTWGFPDFVRTYVRTYVRTSVRTSVRPYVRLHIRFQFYPTRSIYLGPPIFLQIPDLLCIDY